MAGIIAFPLHRLAGVDVPCPLTHYNTSCAVCDGGLALCVTCGGAESSLTTDCPGFRVEPEVADAVSAGELDYDRRDGWVLRPSGLSIFTRRG